MNIDGDATDALTLKFDLTLPVPPAVAATILQSLSAQVGELHASGRVHRSITLASFEQDSQGTARLPTTSTACWLGRTPITSAWLPPELHGSLPLELPANIEAARATLTNAGVFLDPRQIDIYQLGALLCQLVTGEPVSSYLRNVRTKMLVPEPLRPLVERALGCDGQTRFGTVEEFATMLATVSPEFGAKAIDADRDSQNSSKTKSDTTPSFIASRARDTEISVGPATPNEIRASGDLLPFQTLEHYEILSRIGQGGMGDVYLGYERSLDRKVAIKVLPAEFARQPDFVRRFRTEATSAAKLIHPNVIQIYFIGEAEGHHFFAMQFVEGESLAELLKRQGHLSVDATLTIVEQVFAGLAAAHAQGLVHRDIKPGNILLDGKNHALLADFGLVKSLQASSTGKTVTGVVMGTADYMPPEQARGKEVDHRADLYSMGVLMYQMLSGRLPFEADTPTALIFQHVYEQPQPLRELASHVPEAMAEVVEKLLQKSPDERQQNAEDVIAELQGIRSGTFETGQQDKRRAPSESEPSERRRSSIDQSVSKTSINKATPLGFWDRIRDRAASLFHRHAPEVLLELQNTQQQVGGAIADYERRQQKYKKLVAESESVLIELKSQAVAQRAAAKKDVSAANVADSLEQQVAEHEEQLGSIQLKQAKVAATLQQLKSQRDLLNARLRTAEAVATVAGGRVRRPRTWKTSWLVGGTAVVTIAAALFFGGAWSGFDSERKLPIESYTDRTRGVSQKKPNAPFPTTVRKSDAVDMLQLVDLSRDVFAGTWRKDGEYLNASVGGRIYLPVKVPEDYQLHFKITRLKGRDTFTVGFMMAGRQGMMAFDFAEARGCGLYLDRAEPRVELAPGAVFQNNVPATIVLTIHPGHLHVTVDGKTILDWHGDPSRLYLSTAHGLPCRENPFLAIASATYQIASATMAVIPPESVPSRLPRLESSVDIMPLFDMKRDAVLGTWKLDDDSLFCPGIHYNEIYLPVEVPEEYTVSATLEVPDSLAGDPVFTLGILSGHSLSQIAVCSHGGGIALDALDGRRWNNNETYLPGVSFKPRRPATIDYTVTKHGVRFELDGRTLLNWQGDPHRLSIPPEWALPDGRKLFIGSMGQCRFRNLRIGPPLEKPIQSDQTPFKVSRRVDLLPYVDTERDRLRGTWIREGKTLRVWGDLEHNMLTIPCDVPDEYKLTIVVARSPGGISDKECLLIKLPIGGSIADIGIDAYASTVSGIYLDGDGVDRKEFAIANVIPSKSRQELTCFVRRTGIKVVTPDRTIIDWHGNPERLASNTAHATPGGQIAIGSWNTGFRFDRLEIEPLEPTVFPPTTDTGAGGQLLPVISAERDSRKGNWRQTSEGLANTSGVGCRLRIPVTPPKQYVLSAKVERLSGSSQLCFGLVVGANSCGAVLDAGTRFAGLERIDDHDLTDKLNLTRRSFQTMLLPQGKTVTIRCFVLPDAVVVTCDDKEIVRWHGDPRRLSVDPAFLPPNYSDADRTHLWIGARDSQFLIRDLELHPLTDDAANTIAKTFSGVYPITSRISDPLIESELDADSLMAIGLESPIILSAKYVGRNETVDITERLASDAAGSGGILLIVDESLASLGRSEIADASAGTPNSLRLHYRLNSVDRVRTFRENEVVQLGSSLRKSTAIAKEFKLLEARMGVGLYEESNWEDVTIKLRSFASKDDLSITADQLSKTVGRLNSSSNENVRRSLFVRYQHNGRERRHLIPNGTPVLLGEILPKQGLVATIFNGNDFQRQHSAQIAWNIDEAFGYGAPVPGINPDDFSMRWQGMLRVPTAGHYTLILTHDDGGRLWIDGNLIIDNWGSAGREQAEIDLTDQLHSIMVEYCERQVGAAVRLEWESSSIRRQSIPPTAFFHDPQLAIQLGVK